MVSDEMIEMEQSMLLLLLTSSMTLVFQMS